MVFKFKALTTENEEFVRDYELKYDSTLLDFHNLICEDLEYDNEEMASFFLSNKSWEKVQEFTLLDMMGDGDTAMDGDDDRPMCMEEVVLGNVIREKHARLIYTFDLLNDRALYIELIEACEADVNIAYPIIAAAVGLAPAQYGEEPEGALFNEVMDEFGDDFDDYGFDEFGDEYSSGGYDEDYY